MHERATGVFRFGIRSGVPVFPVRVQLQLQGNTPGPWIARADIDACLATRLVVVALVERGLPVHARKPGYTVAETAAEKGTQDRVGGAGAGLQRAFRHFAVAVCHIDFPGRQLYAELQAECAGVGLHRSEAVAADDARVACLGKAPGFGSLSAGVIVDVRVAAVHNRQLHADSPVRIEGVIESGDDVAVDGADFVVIPGNLADSYIPGAGARLILIDELIAKVEAPACFGPCALGAPVGIQRAECRPAACVGFGCGGEQGGNQHNAEKGHGYSWRENAMLWSSQPDGNATCCRTPRCRSGVPVECRHQGDIPMKLDISASPAESRLKRLFWLRNVSIAGQVAAVLIAQAVFAVELPLAVLAASIGALALINVATAMRLGRTAEVSDQEVFLQLCADVALLTASLYFTGGATHPFVSLYLLPLMIAATGVPAPFTLAMAGA